MKKWRKLSYIGLRNLNQQLSFGRQLGINALPWIKKYGDKWQYHLAKAVSSGKNTYNGLRVPRSLQRSDADLYLRSTEKIAGRTPLDRKIDNAELITHQHQRAARFKSREFQRRIQQQAKLRDHTNRVRRTKNNLRKHQVFSNTIFDTSPPKNVLKKNAQDGRGVGRTFGNPGRNQYPSTLRRYDKAPGSRDKSTRAQRMAGAKTDKNQALKREFVSPRMEQMASMREQYKVIKKMDLHRAKFDNRDIGVAIGSMAESEKEKSDIERLIDRLKKGLPINKAGYMKIAKDPELRERIIRAVGSKYYHELFVKKYNEVLYSGNRSVDTRPFMQFFRKGDLGDIMKSDKTKEAYYKLLPKDPKLK